MKTLYRLHLPIIRAVKIRRGPNMRMTHQSLNRLEIIPVTKKGRRKRMPQDVRMYPLLNQCLFYHGSDQAVKRKSEGRELGRYGGRRVKMFLDQSFEKARLHVEAGPKDSANRIKVFSCHLLGKLLLQSHIGYVISFSTRSFPMSSRRFL